MSQISDPGPSEIRVSDTDRDETLERLRHHVTEGRLTLDEFADRVDVVLASRTRADLVAVTADLPAPSPSPAAGPSAREDRKAPRRWVVGILSGGKVKGPWKAGHSVTAIAIMGNSEVDFRQAEMNASEVRVTAVAIMGGVDVIVPEGIAVELTGFPIMGGKDLKVADVPVLPGSPVVRVRAFPIMGGVRVRSKPSRARTELVPGAAPTEPQPAIAPGDLPELLTTPAGNGGLGSSEGTVTIMFSDVAGYSALNERLGDLAAHEVLRAHNAILREQMATHGGQEVKSQGDGFMIAFPSATRALRCAVSIQKALDKYCSEHPGEPIQVHIGLDTGEPIRDGGDLLGRTVITASRLSDSALPGEILVSSLLYELTKPTGEFRFGEPREVELKGISGARTVYPANWRD